MAAKINRTGKTYGDLTVLETILGSNSKKDTYLVKCNCCGNTMIIGIDALLKGLKCKNCRNKDRKSTYQDLIGKECNGIKVVSLAEDSVAVMISRMAGICRMTPANPPSFWRRNLKQKAFPRKSMSRNCSRISM